MATQAGTATPVSARVGRGFMADQGFFTRFALVLALFILFGFAQFGLRGFVDVRAVPPLVHLHGLLMLAWLGLLVTQNLLAGRGEIGLHRKIGWVASALVAGIAVIGCTIGYMAVANGRVPPFFSNPYFLALTWVETIAFAVVVAWAVQRRRNTQWHRRLMLGATVLILEPALGRLLPMPLMNGWGEWVIMVIQLLALGVLARHDRKLLGQVHPATLSLMAVVVAVHLLIAGLAVTPAFVELAGAVAAG